MMTISDKELLALGLGGLGQVHMNLSRAALIEEALKRGEGRLSAGGALVCETGHHTGRSPNDKFIVEEPSSKDRIWWGKVNRPVSEATFDRLLGRVQAYMQGREVFVQDLFAGADPQFRLPIRVVTQHAWHAAFANNMFVRPVGSERQGLEAEATVLHVPDFEAVPEIDGTNSSTFIMVHFGRRLVLIGGTQYAGEIKKSIFTLMNYLLPQRGVMSMHASANIGASGDVAVFFGLSGTGKTTLSADPDRKLIGDDEHGWADGGVFNVEGGCYAKVIKLSRTAEPEIYATTAMHGTILENVVMDPQTRALDLDSDARTENTRAAYQLDAIPNYEATGKGGHPRTILMLTCDAFGVMPPLARLTPEQAMYHFLAGYTAKVAGTERGVKEPSATFSTCFGAPFMSLHPTVYAKLLGEKIARHGTTCYLVNTGWSGGAYGVGSRMKIAHTRALVRAALSGELDKAEFEQEAAFGFQVPKAVEGVPAEVLLPRNTWTDKAAYDATAAKLSGMFRDAIAQFEGMVDAHILDAGPKAIAATH
ncbi:MAG: phosphoenolpyruvate carboxykinase (ATP) [Candidatus Sericytochromatia bacterium]|nr:phosphoenolpyruvate carboxykinase (ATP) [Candidatus Sericytochromatia bacterium]